MIEGALLAFAIGVKNATTGRAFVFVRDAGPPVPFEVSMRQRDSKDTPWVEVEGLKYFPTRPTTSTTGRRVTIALPPDLQRFVQVCAITPPSYDTKLKRRSLADLKTKPADGASSGPSAQLNLRVMSCVNLRPLSTEQGSTS